MGAELGTDWDRLEFEADEFLGCHGLVDNQGLLERKENPSVDYVELFRIPKEIGKVKRVAY